MLVYKITNMVTGMAYIGVTTVGVEERFQLHLRDGRLPNPKRYLHRAIAKYGPEAFKVEQIAEASSMDELLDLERDMVIAYGTFAPVGYNMTSGGETMKEWCGDLRRETSITKKAWAASPEGRVFLAEATAKSRTPEARAKSEESLRRYRASPEGRAHVAKCVAAMHTAEARAKDAAKKRGKKLSDETKAKMAEAHRGLKHSPETRAKMSATRAAWWQADESRRAVQSARNTAAMADPAARERIRQSNLKTWAAPELRARHSQCAGRPCKMTDADCLHALAMLADGETATAVANLYDVSIGLISQLSTGRIRKHLSRPVPASAA